MEENTNLNRRTVLQGIGAGAATTMGVSGAAAADNGLRQKEIERAVEDYRDGMLVENIFANHADVLEKTIEIDEIELPSTSVGELNVGLASDAEGDVEARNVHTSFNARRVDGEATPEIHYQLPTEGGMLNVVVLPELDDRYAIFDPEEGDLKEIEGPSIQGSCGGCPNNKECQCSYECVSCSCGYPGCPSCGACDSCSVCSPQYREVCSCNCVSCGLNCVFQCP
ncbi:solute carrier organic anion transporter [Halorussus salinus]|uniref:solute carrier organic anion transporter n=1 Tax=Halorussus salinus TaxID=1364935 RepID=UPI001092CB00|nr:solute carrier organic anion transporter [Halorussus salinus]